MKNKYILIIGIILVIGISIFTFMMFNKNKNFNPDTEGLIKIEDNYIAVFHGGSGEVTFNTYVYKIDNGHDNMGFRYIATKCITKSWGSSEYTETIIDNGEVNFTDDVFTIAKKYNSYDYVTIPGSDKSYSIEEYQSMFLMN